MTAPSGGRAAAAPAEACGVQLEIGGERVVLYADRAMHWPARETLIVADLHLGKEETFRHFGLPMPPEVLDESLARLDRLATRLGARRIVVVGDLIHAASGLTDEVTRRVSEWRASFAGEVDLVIGNHEARIRAFPPSWRLRIRGAELDEAPFRFAHEPPLRAVRDRHVISGHFHPCVACGGVVLPCFAVGADRTILPAFTRFSRGVRCACGPAERIFAIADGQVIELRPDPSG